MMHLYFGTEGVGIRTNWVKAFEKASVTFSYEDESTAVFPSQTAWSTCKFMRNFANNGQAILCSSHQTSASLDQLLILGRGGKPLYLADNRLRPYYHEGLFRKTRS